MQATTDFVRELWDKVRGSLFYVPALFIVGALASARLLTWVDGTYNLDDLPVLLRSPIIRSTAGGARALLGTTAGATITVAGIVFSVTVVSVQLASSQFSPRVLSGFLRDPFKQNVMGFVVGTFTYCLVVLAVIRAEFDDTGFERIEVAQRRLAVTVALALAVLAILAIVAFIDQSARSMQVGELVRKISDETTERLEALHSQDATGDSPDADSPMPEGAGFVVRARADGWVQRVHIEGLLALIPPGGVARLDTRVGAFLAQQLPLVTLWPEPDEPDKIDERVQDLVKLGRTRTLRQDPAFGIRQLVDIALRALSPGINDPTTANEVLVHLSGIVREIMLHDLPPRIVTGEDGRRLYMPHNLNRADYVAGAFSEIRVAAVGQPSVLRTLVRVLAGLDALLTSEGLAERARPLRKEAELVLDGLEDTVLLEDDVSRVREKAERLADDAES